MALSKAEILSANFDGEIKNLPMYKLFKMCLLGICIMSQMDSSAQAFIYTFEGEIDSLTIERIELDFKEIDAFKLKRIEYKSEKKRGALFFDFKTVQEENTELSSFSFPLFVKNILIENQLFPLEFYKL